MERVKGIVNRILEAVLIILMGASVLNVLWQVFSRFVLGVPSSLTEEIARFLLIWIGVLGAGYAVGRGDHLAFELLPRQLSGAARAWLQIGIQSCVALFAGGVLVLGGVRLVYLQLSLGQTSAALGLPMGYVYLALPLSGVVMCFYTAVHIRTHAHSIFRSPSDDASTSPSTSLSDSEAA